MRDNYLEEYYSFLRFPSVSTDDQYKEKLVQCADWLVNKLTVSVCKRSLYPQNVIPLCGPAMNTTRSSDGFDLWPLRCAAADPLELWDSPPFEPVLKNGYVFARGPLTTRANPRAHSRNSGNDRGAS